MRLTDRSHNPASGPTYASGPAEAVRAPTPLAPHAPGQTWVEERTRVAVSRNINVSGKLVFQEPVRIEGHFRGEVSSTDLVVIAEEGVVDGRIRAPRLLILGELQGDIIDAKSLVLGPRSRVKGGVATEILTVCEGARLEGDLIVGPASRRVSALAEPPASERG